MSWARLLKRVFNIDIERCPMCGGDLKIIAAIEERVVIKRTLMRPAWCAQPPPRQRRAAGYFSGGLSVEYECSSAD